MNRNWLMGALVPSPLFVLLAIFVAARLSGFVTGSSD